MPSLEPCADYSVMSMKDLALVPHNGVKVASFFAGGGGSSTGYRMAGCHVLYANEFVNADRATYEANMRPGTIVDSRDIRAVRGEDVLDACGVDVGELDILDGSPPCASFSVSGKRNAKWGKSAAYSDTKQRTDDLFFEYARLISTIQPKIFVAENVSGLVKGVSKGYFVSILGQLRSAGYAVTARLLDAQWLGVPQARQRLIFVGVRRDLKLSPVHPKPHSGTWSTADALKSVPRIAMSEHGPGTASRYVHEQSSLKNYLENSCTWDASGLAYDTETGERIDLLRFALQSQARILRMGKNSDRYFNLTRAHLDRPCSSITATTGSLSAASPIHPTSIRKFTVPELRAISSFPPDYKLLGTYSQRVERIGRSVPPLMMKEVASVLVKLLSQNKVAHS